MILALLSEAERIIARGNPNVNKKTIFCGKISDPIAVTKGASPVVTQFSCFAACESWRTMVYCPQPAAGRVTRGQIRAAGDGNSHNNGSGWLTPSCEGGETPHAVDQLPSWTLYRADRPF